MYLMTVSFENGSNLHTMAPRFYPLERWFLGKNDAMSMQQILSKSVWEFKELGTEF